MLYSFRNTLMKCRSICTNQQPQREGGVLKEGHVHFSIEKSRGRVGPKGSYFSIEIYSVEIEKSPYEEQQGND